MPAPRPAWLEKIEARQERYYPLAVALLGLFLLVPLIGSFGLWDPQEFPLADLAREVARTGDYASVMASRPPLSAWLSAFSVSLLGPSELAVRLPHALLGVLGALAAYGTGRRLRTPRAGLLAGVAFLTTPLVIFQARQLTTDMGALAGSALAIYGLCGLAWPGDGAGARKPLALGLDLLATLVGLGLGVLGYGIVLGVGVPLTGLALASSATAFGKNPSDPAARRRQIVVALVAGAAALVIVLAWYGARHDKGFVKLIGGTFRAGAEPPANATFDYLVNQLAFGLFPWSAVAPIAVVRLLLVRQGDRRAWGGLLVVTWAAAAYVAGALWMREMGELRYPGLVAIALAVGILLDDLLATRKGDAVRWPAAVHGLPLLALFVFCAAFQLARDIKEFPEQLASVHLLTEIKFPAVVTGLASTIKWLGLAFAFLAAFGIASSSRPAELKREPVERSGLDPVALKLLDLMKFIGDNLRGLAAPVMDLLRRFGLAAAIAVSVIMGFYLSLVYTPTLSHHFSYKNVFDTYQRLEKGGEPVGVMGIAGSGPDFYAHGKLEKLNDLNGLTSFLRRDGRVFAVAPATELCGIQQQATTQGFPYFVASTENSRYFLYTNKLEAGEKDANPLARMIFRQPPTGIQIPVSAKYVPSNPGQSGELELLGVDMPTRIKKGKTFTMKVYFKVNARVPQNFQMFVHFDRGAVRFQGDHWPLDNLCGTQYWQPGDYVVDSFQVEAGQTFSPRGPHEVWLGLFTGGAGTWKNMTVSSGNGDKNNRVKVGTLELL
jgi:4-amino-4-deoxy-L-arabinose transferase-like glycosyltransferase